MWIVKASAVMFVALALSFSAQPAHAGTIILEGSDAIGFHCALGVAGACTYRDQAFSAIGGADPRPIAVIGSDVLGDPNTVSSGTHAVMDFSDLTAAGALSQYVALYFLATSGCCSENDALPAGHEADISAYLAAGGTVMIENYIGGPAWDFAVGTGGAGNAHVGGVAGGLPGPGCDDGETVTADGLANGFTQPPPISCWTHQGYQQSFFGPLGFTKSFFDSPPAYLVDNPGLGSFSSLLSNGNTVTGGTVPEPASLILLGSGLLGLGGTLRRKLRR
jgi:hypothetical protein